MLRKKVMLVAVLALSLMAVASMSFAFTNVNGFLQDIYNLIDDIANGPVGQGVALGLIVIGAASMVFRQPLAGVLAIVSGGVIALAPTIVGALGALLV